MILVLVAILVAMGIIVVRREYLKAVDPPLWPRGEQFCEGAAITSLVPNAQSWGAWPKGWSPTTVRIDDRLYFHPVSGASDAMMEILYGDRDMAERLADRLYSHAVGGWLPYTFDWEWPEGHMIEAPWRSAMAQGVALSVYSRLEQRERADEAFGTVIEMQRADGWLPEYPAGPDVLNGHIFAVFGLYDYWQYSGRGESETLTAIRVVADRLTEWRRVGRVSRYAGSYPAYGGYHQTHVRLLHRLAAISGDACFDETAEAWDSDA